MARKAKESPTTIEANSTSTLRCMCCGKEYETEHFYISNSVQFKAFGKIPYCQQCLGEIYNDYKKIFTKLGCVNPEIKAVRRFCMAFDLYYSEKLYNSAVNYYLKQSGKSNKDYIFITFYFQQLKLKQYKNKTYNTTISEEHKQSTQDQNLKMFDSGDSEHQAMIDKATKFFGAGFEVDDYIFLQEQYEDWVTRHECQSKSQEEMFKNICFSQLNIWKAERAGEDTKDLQATFLKQLEAGKLQPKQNKGDTTSETQTFGTLIEKWENTRPIPEIDEELRDVDKIGLYLDVFFRGHLAKMMGLKNGVSHLYEKYMAKYTVQKPEYNDDEDGEALFDAIFGNSSNINDD